MTTDTATAPTPATSKAPPGYVADPLLYQAAMREASRGGVGRSSQEISQSVWGLIACLLMLVSSAALIAARVNPSDQLMVGGMIGNLMGCGLGIAYLSKRRSQ